MNKLRASNADLAEVVKHMTRLEPESRFSVDEYLQSWPKEVFPAFFGPLHDLLSPLMTWAQDHSVLLLKASFSGFLTRLQRKSEVDRTDDDVAAIQIEEPPCDTAETDEGSLQHQMKQLSLSEQVAGPQHATQGGACATGSGVASSSSVPPGGAAAPMSVKRAQTNNENTQAGTNLKCSSPIICAVNINCFMHQSENRPSFGCVKVDLPQHTRPMCGMHACV